MDISLSEIKGIGPARLKAFEAAGIRTVRELTMFLPKEYRDLTATVPLAGLQPGDTAAVRVRVAGEAVVMSPKEVEILHLMAAHPGQVFTREQLLDSIWGFDFDGDDRVVDTSVKRIRKKLPEGCSLQLKSVYGVGYKLEAENA